MAPLSLPSCCIIHSRSTTTVYCGVSQRFTVYCGVLQRFTVYCGVFQWRIVLEHFYTFALYQTVLNFPCWIALNWINLQHILTCICILRNIKKYKYKETNTNTRSQQHFGQDCTELWSLEAMKLGRAAPLDAWSLLRKKSKYLVFVFWIHKIITTTIQEAKSYEGGRAAPLNPFKEKM